MTAAEPALDGACATCERRPAVEGCPTGLCLLCRATSPETLEAIGAGEIPAGSVRADVVPGAEPCTRCKIPSRRLVQAHWSEASRLCPRCCGLVAAEQDREGAPCPAEPLDGSATGARTRPVVLEPHNGAEALTVTDPEAAYRRGVAEARRVRRSTIDDLAAIVAAGDTSREAERNLRLWVLDRLTAADAEDDAGPRSAPDLSRPPTPETPHAG